MKLKTGISILTCLWALSLSAQWHDRRWLLGASIDTLGSGTVDLVFTEDTVHLEYNNRGLAIYPRQYYIGRTQVSVSDSSGKFLFNCNGTKVYNRQNKIMTNGDSINYNDYWGGGANV